MTHIVNSLQFEVTCPDEDMCFNLRQNFAQTFQLEIAEVIDAVCSKYVTEYESVKIDKLELDLGAFSKLTFGTDFKKMLTLKLDSELKNRVSKITPDERYAFSNLSAIETLIYFLTNGSLPWFADENKIDLNKICEDVLPGNGFTFKHFFYTNRLKKNIWNRVLWQLNNRSKELLISILPHLQAAKEILDSWAAELRINIKELKTVAAAKAFSNTNDLLIENAPVIYSSAYGDVLVLKKLFKLHLTTVFKEDKVLYEQVDFEFEAIANATTKNAAIKSEMKNTHHTGQEDIIDPHINSQNADKIFSANEGENVPEKLMVRNAGLVLLAPFLRPFFKELGYLEADGWKNQEITFRAVHLLKYLSNGELKTPEYSMVLEKLLCGLPLDMPVPLDLSLEDREIEEATSLLEAVIKHWSVLKNTSVNGLRETFFKRDGILTKKNDDWLIQIERKTLDVLLESVPWGYSTISLAWSKYLIFVEW